MKKSILVFVVAVLMIWGLLAVRAEVSRRSYDLFISSYNTEFSALGYQLVNYDDQVWDFTNGVWSSSVTWTNALSDLTISTNSGCYKLRLPQPALATDGKIFIRFFGTLASSFDITDTPIGDPIQLIVENGEPVLYDKTQWIVNSPNRTILKVNK